MSSARPTTSTAATERELVARHAELVKRIAYHLAARLPASVEVDDLIQAGVIGLLEAARHYNGDRGASFETYAGIRIRGAMVDELRKSDWAPRSVHRRAREAAAVISDIEQHSGREARETEIAEKLGIPLEEYRQIAFDAARCHVLSFDAHADEDGAPIDLPSDGPGPSDELARDEFQRELARAIGDMPEREKQVLAMYYQDEMNLREIGAVLEVSESRACQIHGQALLRLRARMHEWRSEAIHE
ncbi:MAG TPA: RNA polymerase sigma factor FliA [Nevskiaceae bacterium]|nr:RNA polymerase sigma factor FliA [Nevskiaceae bacterium]